MIAILDYLGSKALEVGCRQRIGGTGPVEDGKDLLAGRRILNTHGDPSRKLVESLFLVQQDSIESL